MIETRCLKNIVIFIQTILCFVLSRKSWKICTALNDYITLNDFYYVEWFVQRWIICSTTLNYLDYVEWFILRWMIFYFVVKFVWPRMICTALKDLYNVEWFGVRWMICTTLNRWIADYQLFNVYQVCLFEKILQDILH